MLTMSIHIGRPDKAFLRLLKRNTLKIEVEEETVEKDGRSKWKIISRRISKTTRLHPGEEKTPN